MKQKSKDTLYYPYIGREHYIAEIETCLFQKDNYHLHFYGIGGVGKSSLKRIIQRSLNNNKNFMYLHLDFEFKQYQNISQALLSLRSSVLKRYKFVRFTNFDIVYSIYWKKLNPLVKIKEDSVLPFLEEGDLGTTIYDGVKDTLLGVIPKAANIGYKVYNKTKGWLDQRNITDLEQLNELEAEEIELFLPKFWIDDFNKIINTKNVHSILLLDTLEKIGKLSHGKFVIDESFNWVDQLIQSFSNASIISFGREQIENSNQSKLKQYEVLPFDYDETCKLLENNFIRNKEIKEELFKATQGIPYYLDLAIKTYNRIGLSRLPDKKDFEGDLEKVIERFVKYLTEDEKSILEVLSVPKGWNESLYDFLFSSEDNLIQKRASFIEGCSFVKYNEDLKQYTMHEIMREFLLKSLEKNVKRYKLINQKVYRFYKTILLDINYSAQPGYSEYILGETFYHAKNLDNFDDFISIIRMVCCGSYSTTYNLLIEEIFLFIKNHSEDILTLYHLSEILGGYNIYCANIENATLYVKEFTNLFAALDEEDQVQRVLNYTYILTHFFSLIKDYRNAEKSTLDILDLLNKMGGPEDYSIEKKYLYSDLLFIYTQLGELENANYYSDLSLKNDNEEMTQEYAIKLSNVGLVNLQNNRFEDALKNFNHGLAILEGQNYFSERSYFILKGNQAQALIGLGKFEEAIKIHEEVLKKRIEILSEDHVDTAESYIYVCDFYKKDTQKYKLRRLYLVKAIEILSKVNPSINLLNAYSLLYELELENGNEKEAIKNAKKSVETRPLIFDESSIEMAIGYENLGGTYQHFGKFEEALECFNKGIEIVENRNDSRSKELYFLLGARKGKVLRNLRLFKDAQVIYQKVLPLAEKDSLEQSSIYNFLGITLRNLGDYHGSERNYKKALRIRQEHLSEDHSELGIINMNLGHIYKILKAKKKGKEHLEEALRILNINRTKHKEELFNICSALAEIYLDSNNLEKYKYYLDLCEDIKPRLSNWY